MHFGSASHIGSTSWHVYVLDMHTDSQHTLLNIHSLGHQLRYDLPQISAQCTYC